MDERSRLGSRFGALAERPFRLLWLARTSSSIGDSLIPVALAFAILEELDASAGELGLVLAAFSLARVSFTLVGGVWADRLERRRLMLVCDVVRAAVEVLTFALLLTGAMEIWMFAVTAAAFGAASAFFGPASTGLVAETASRARLQQANALIGVSESATHIAGPALAGILVATVGPAWVFAVDAATFVASAAFLLALRVAPRVLPERQNFVADLAAGWREVRARAWLSAGLVAFSLSNLASATFFVLGPVVFAAELGGAADWGLAMSIAAAGGLVGSAIALRLRPARPLVVAFAVWTATALPHLALVGPLPAVAVGAAAGMSFASVALGNTVWEATLQREVPPAVLSRVSSYDWLVSLVFMPVGFALAGPAADAIGTDKTLWAAAAIAFGAHLAVLAVPSARRLRADTRPPVELAEPSSAVP